MGLHMGAVGHMVKRSVQVFDSFDGFDGFDGFPDMAQNPDQPQFDLPDVNKFGLVCLILTLIVSAVGITLIRYTLWNVVGTLALVEHPQTTVLINGYKDDNAAPGEPEEALILNEKPITSSIRSTIRHLHRQAGWKSRYRGMALAIVRGIAGGVLGELVLVILRQPSLSMQSLLGWGFFSQLIATMITSLALARWSVAWTHIVVSEPSSKPWYRRIPPMNTFRQVALPTLAYDTANALNILVPAVVFAAMQSDSEFDKKSIGSVVLAFVVGIFMAIFITLPCFMAMSRVYASLLPAEHEPIVPFDRTFGGKVVPKELGGSGVLSWRDALRTLDAEARGRLLKLFGKFILIDIGLHLFLATCILLQVYFVFGSHLKALLDHYNNQQGAQHM